MSFGVFLLLFGVFFLLMALVVWVVKAPKEGLVRDNEPREEFQPGSPDDPDETIQWLEEFATKQEQSRPRRLH